MRTLERVRALFPVGAWVECVENMYRPELNGTRRRVIHVQKQRLGVEVLSGPGVGEPFDMVLPGRAGDVLELTENRVRYRLGRGDHTATYRVIGVPVVERDPRATSTAATRDA
jgi:hypothetical protein